MDVGKLAIFLDTVSMGSMKKAAEKYNYTQAGMVYLMNSVEKEVGVNVIVRTHKGIAWNQAGRELEPYLRRLIEADRDAAEKIALLTQNKSTSIVAGACPSIASNILPQVMTAFLSKRSSANITLRMGNRELLGWLESGEIDFAVLPREEAGSCAEGYEWIPLMSVQTCAAIPASFLTHPAESIRIEEFVSFPFLYSASNPINEAISSKFEMAEGSKISVSTLDGLGTLRLVDQGLGATCITGLYKNICPRGVVMLPFDPPIVHHYYIARKASSRLKALERDFIEILQQHCRDEYGDAESVE